MPGRSLLVVLAHPDDEIFVGGMIASLSDRGVPVTLVCATRGEAGDVHPSVGPVGDLGALRVEELRRSCRVLGIADPVLLRFHDSGRDGHRPAALAQVDMREVEASILDVIGDVKPQVVLTFDPHGWYYHPDHLAVQRATTAAFFSSGARGGQPPVRLFCGTMLTDVFRHFADASRGLGIVDGLDPRLFATSEESIAVSFDASAYLDRKLLALAAHQSAFGITAEMLLQPPPEAVQTLHAFRPVLQRETFVLAGARGTVPQWPLADFFDGL